LIAGGAGGTVRRVEGTSAPPEQQAEPAEPDARTYLRLVLFAAALGIPAALVAALFLALVHEAEGWLWDDLTDALGYDAPPWFMVVGPPVVGAAVVAVARRWLPGDGGHAPLHGLGGPPTPVSHAPGVVLAALGTLCFGAVLGPEAPVIALGSVVGMATLYLVRTDGRGVAVLSTAGSFSAMSALFGGPLVAGMLLMEAGLEHGKRLVWILVPGLVSAAVGYVIFVGLGDWGGLNAAGLAVPDLPVYEGTHVLDLAVGIVVGALAAIVVTSVRRLGSAIDRVGGERGLVVLLLAGGLAVGLLAQLADVLGADASDVLFSGQASIPAVVGEGSTWALLVLLVAKFLAYGVSLGCGFRGGPVFPAIFLGIGLATFAVVWFDVSPTLAVAVGAAAGMAAQTRLLLAPLVFSALLIGGVGLDAIPATVLASTTAWLGVEVLDRRAARAGIATP
jgi:H+/Cl- antiporter ClcA